MTIKKNRKTYTTEFKAEALKLAERVGVAEAAQQLKIYETQIYNWRNAVATQLNERPRKTLKFKTPSHMIAKGVAMIT